MALGQKGTPMGTLRIADSVHSVDALVFDKDGTLFDFQTLWGGWADLLLREVAARVDRAGDPGSLGAWIGWDAERHRHDPAGPLAAGSMAEVLAAVATGLYRSGVPWHQAKEAVAGARRAVDAGVDWPSALRPVAGVVALLTDAVSAGVAVGVVTADDTAAALMHLGVAGLAGMVGAVIGADLVSAGKPDPEPVHAVCRALRVSPERAALFGDTASDVRAGRRAGVTVVVGVAATGESAALLTEADLVITDFSQVLLEP
jgi:phosphoglycolate phosphatase